MFNVDEFNAYFDIEDHNTDIDVMTFLSKVGISSREFYSGSRRANVIDARNAVCRVLRKSGKTVKQIAPIVGRDYTTVLYLTNHAIPFDQDKFNNYINILQNGRNNLSERV